MSLKSRNWTADSAFSFKSLNLVVFYFFYIALAIIPMSGFPGVQSETSSKWLQFSSTLGQLWTWKPSAGTAASVHLQEETTNPMLCGTSSVWRRRKVIQLLHVLHSSCHHRVCETTRDRLLPFSRYKCVGAGWGSSCLQLSHPGEHYHQDCARPRPLHSCSSEC